MWIWRAQQLVIFCLLFLTSWIWCNNRSVRLPLCHALNKWNYSAYNWRQIFCKVLLWSSCSTVRKLTSVFIFETLTSHVVMQYRFNEITWLIVPEFGFFRFKQPFGVNYPDSEVRQSLDDHPGKSHYWLPIVSHDCFIRWLRLLEWGQRWR